MEDSDRHTRRDIEKLSLKEFAQSLTLRQAVGILSVLGALVAGSFSVGLRWESLTRSSEVERLRTRLEVAETRATRAESTIADLRDEIHFLRAKEKFLGITATVQFHGLLLGKDPDDLFSGGVRTVATSEDELASLLGRYDTVITEITRAADGRPPVADLHFPRIGPPLVIFREDTTPWVLMRSQ